MARTAPQRIHRLKVPDSAYQNVSRGGTPESWFGCHYSLLRTPGYGLEENSPIYWNARFGKCRLWTPDGSPAWIVQSLLQSNPTGGLPGGVVLFRSYQSKTVIWVPASQYWVVAHNSDLFPKRRIKDRLERDNTLHHAVYKNVINCMTSRTIITQFFHSAFILQRSSPGPFFLSCSRLVPYADRQLVKFWKFPMQNPVYEINLYYFYWGSNTMNDYDTRSLIHLFNYLEVKRFSEKLLSHLNNFITNHSISMFFRMPLTNSLNRLLYPFRFTLPASSFHS